MPIDPNEPLYCFCKRVSFGEMVGCDNPEVGTSPPCSSAGALLAHCWRMESD